MLQALAAAAARPLALRGVYRFGGSGAGKQQPATIVCVGRVDHLLHDARLQIMGLADES